MREKPISESSRSSIFIQKVGIADDSDIEQRIVMAIPHPTAIRQLYLYQCCTTIEDIQQPPERASSTLSLSKEEINDFASRHRKRVITKIESSQLAQIHEVTTYYGEELDSQYKWILLQWRVTQKPMTTSWSILVEADISRQLRRTCVNNLLSEEQAEGDEEEVYLQENHWKNQLTNKYIRRLWRRLWWRM